MTGSQFAECKKYEPMRGNPWQCANQNQPMTGSQWLSANKNEPITGSQGLNTNNYEPNDREPMAELKKWANDLEPMIPWLRVSYSEVATPRKGPGANRWAEIKWANDREPMADQNKMSQWQRFNGKTQNYESMSGCQRQMSQWQRRANQWPMRAKAAKELLWANSREAMIRRYIRWSHLYCH